MLDSLCQWPFLSWVALIGFVLLVAARGRIGEERQEMTAGTVPNQFRVDSKRTVQSPAEDGRHYEVQFTDSDGASESVRVSKSVYKRINEGDPLAVYRHPRSTGYVHESEPLSFSRASTSVLWALAWVLIFVGVVDIAVYLIIDESPWCFVIRR
jgi:hypothetical protein